MNLNIATNDTP
jgi:hypothetical protein